MIGMSILLIPIAGFSFQREDCGRTVSTYNVLSA